MKCKYGMSNWTEKVTVEVRRAPLAEKRNSLEKNKKQKKDLKLKIARRTPNSCPPTWGALSEVFNCLVLFL